MFISVRLLGMTSVGVLFKQGCRLKLCWLPWHMEKNTEYFVLTPKGFQLQVMPSLLLTFDLVKVT